MHNTISPVNDDSMLSKEQRNLKSWHESVKQNGWTSQDANNGAIKEDESEYAARSYIGGSSTYKKRMPDEHAYGEVA